MFGFYHKKNALIHLSDSGSFFIGISLCSFNVVIPAYISLYTHNPFLLSLIPLIVDFGMSIPQTYAVYLNKQSENHNPIFKFFLYELIHRITFLIIGISILIFAKDKTLSLISFFIFFIISNISWGFSYPNWVETVSLTMPEDNRAEFLGKRDAAARTIGLLFSFLLPYILSLSTFPYNYGILFLFAGLFFTIGVIPVKYLEIINPVVIDNKNIFKGISFLEYLKIILKRLWRNKKRLYLLMIFWALAVSRITYSFYTPFVMENIIIKYPEKMQNLLISIMNTLFLLFTIITSRLIGSYLHKNGTKKSLFLAIASLVLTNLIVVLFPYYISAIIGYFFLAAFMYFIYIIPFNTIMTHTPQYYRSVIMSMSNSINAIMILIFNLIGSVIVKNSDKRYALIFTVIIALVLIPFLKVLKIKK